MVARLAVVAALLSWAAQNAAAETYPAAEGFDRAGSDAKAIEIADAVMKKWAGGRIGIRRGILHGVFLEGVCMCGTSGRAICGMKTGRRSF